MPRTLTEKQMDAVITLRSKEIAPIQIAEIVGIGRSTVDRICQIYKAAQDGDTDTLTRLGSHAQVVDWACRRAGLKNDKPADNTATAFATLIESVNALTAAIRSIDSRLSAIQMTQQGAREDIATAAKKIVETVNINGDILTKEHERIIDLLGGIKMNTRKRGNNGTD